MEENMEMIKHNKNERVLFITDSYYPHPFPTGICTHEIAKEYRNNGVEVHVVCLKKSGDKKDEVFEGIYTHKVSMTIANRFRMYAHANSNLRIGRLASKIFVFMNRIKTLLFLKWFPLTTPLTAWALYWRALKLHEDLNFDQVILTHKPLETLLAGKMLKKKYSGLKVAMYCVDSISNFSRNYSFLSPNWVSLQGRKYEKDLYSTYDYILNMKSHELYYKDKFYDEFRHKMDYVDIPLVSDLVSIKSERKQNLKFIHVGSVRADIIDDFLRIIETLGDSGVEMKTHFYGWSGYGDYKSDYIERHGFVSRSEILDIYKTADYLVSMGNTNSDNIPSKIFEYISTGKKIIHLYRGNTDSCSYYYNMYPNALMICLDDDYDFNVCKISDFIESEAEMIDFEKISELFKLNLASETFRLLNEKMQVLET